MNNKHLAIIALLFVLFGFVIFKDRSPDAAVVPAGANSVIENGMQVVSITARGGYYPEISYIQPDVPTTLRFVTNGTFDCSSIMVIPRLGISKTLPSTGATDINIGALAKGTSLVGSCGMGMYPFEVVAQ